MAKKQIPQDNDWEDVGGWEDIPVKAEPQTSAGQAALEGFGQTASMGYLPQLQAAAEPVTDKLFAMLRGEQAPESKPYVERRDENIARQKLQAQEHPAATLAGQLGGALAGGALLPQAKVAQGAGRLARIAGAAKSGAMAGALYNPGDAQGEVSPLQPAERLKSGAIGGASGAAFQTGAEGLKYLLGGVKNLVGRAGAYASGMTPATAAEYAANPEEVKQLAAMMEKGGEQGLQDIVLGASGQAQQGLGAKITQQADDLKAMLQNKNVEIDPNKLRGISPEIDSMVNDALVRDMYGGVPVNPQAPASKMEAIRSALDKEASYAASSPYDLKARATGSQAKSAADYLRSIRSAQTPEAVPGFANEANLIDLKNALESKVRNTPASTFISDSPDVVGLLQRVDEAAGTKLAPLSRQLTAAKSMVPKGGNVIAGTSAAIRPVGRFVVRNTMAPPKDNAALREALQRIVDAGAVGALEGKRKE